MLTKTANAPRFGLLLLGCAALLSGCGAAQGAVATRSPAADHGARLAARHCATCHAVAPQTASLLADAPPFPQLRARYDVGEMAAILETRMKDIHPRMPLLEMGPDEVNAFLAYWDTVTPATRTEARADTTADVGRVIVVRDCGGCHATGDRDQSAFAGAPPFRVLGARYKIEGLGEALAEGIAVGHPDMPERAYPADQVEAIIAYLQSIQPADRKTP